MLKDIGERTEHAGVISACKQISAWLHNHGQLNAMMRKAIGGELVKWNATRFGTNYMFLDSMYRRRQGFMQMMASPEFQNSKWAHTEEGRFAHFRLSNMDWWDRLKYIIDIVQPVYKLLRFADREKRPNLCEVVYQYQLCKQEMESFFGNNVSTWSEYRQILDRRIRDVTLRHMLVQVILILISKSILMRSQLMLISGHSYFAAGVFNPAL
jgi:hypothetical protein